MQHVYGHGGNLGDECADHAAALGTFGLVSNHNVATRWIHHNFDAIACFDGCHNISEILEGDERVINLQRTKVYVFSDSVLCFGKIFENPESHDAWEQRLGWLKSSSKKKI